MFEICTKKRINKGFLVFYDKNIVFERAQALSVTELSTLFLHSKFKKKSKKVMTTTTPYFRAHK
jgi:hypothetical protein